MSKKFWAVSTEIVNVRIYAVEADTADEAVSILTDKARSKLAKPILNGVSAENVVQVDETTHESFAHAVQIANDIGNSAHIYQENAKAEEVEERILRGEGTELTIDPFATMAPPSMLQ